jgi:DMSO/TMAO reductase YedYZ molybdopterin-dependent catalytic subunit
MGLANRRQLLTSALGALGVAAQLKAQTASTQPAVAGKSPMILHNDFPEDLEMPSEYFDKWITPNDKFFVRQHIPRPEVDLAAFKLTIDGMVAKTSELTLEDLRKLPQHKVVATLECTGNGRGFFRPRVPGIQWGRGAIGNAEWTGPRISDILKLAGAKADARFLTTNGLDVPAIKTPDFIRSLPMSKALHPATLLALEMNGQPIPSINGGPTRMIVPGWDGTSWVKWVNQMTVAGEANTGFFMNPAYRYPRYARPPGAPPVPAELEVIEGMRVKSAITRPSDDDKVTLGPVAISGYAWAGEEKIMRVEVSTDGGSRWKDAELTPQNLNFAWRLFKINWTPAKPGYYTILSRATDSAGNVQPIVASWNPSGYLYNAIDRIGITVEKSA